MDLLGTHPLAVLAYMLSVGLQMGRGHSCIPSICRDCGP